MVQLNMLKNDIINKCNQVGKPMFVINAGLFLLFGMGIIKNLKASKVPEAVFFLLILYFGCACYYGWGFIQMGKMISDEALMNNYTPPRALAFFGRSRDQIVSRLYLNGLLVLVFYGGISVLLGLSFVANILFGKAPVLSISIPLYFGFHAYLGWRTVQLSKLIKADATLFNTGGVHAPAEAVSTTVSMSSMPQSASADPLQGVELKGIVNEEGRNSNQEDCGRMSERSGGKGAAWRRKRRNRDMTMRRKVDGTVTYNERGNLDEMP